MNPQILGFKPSAYAEFCYPPVCNAALYTCAKILCVAYLWSKNKVSDQQIINAAKSSKSMAEAAAKVKLKYSTFRGRAKVLGVFIPNQPGKGLRATRRGQFLKYKLEDILKGKHPEYHSGRLKQRLIAEGIKQAKCEVCGRTKWRGKDIPLELHHKNGDPYDHTLENIQILCPNCHAQTAGFCKKKSK